MTELGELFL